MGHLHDGRAFVIELLEKLHDLFALAGMQIAGGLVGQDQFRISDHGARHRDQLLLPAGQLARVEIALADDVEAVERIADNGRALRALDVAVRERNVEVLIHRQVIDQVVALEYEADVLLVEFDAVLRLHAVYLVAEEFEFARPGAIEHAEDAEQSGFARARRGP